MAPQIIRLNTSYCSRRKSSSGKSDMATFEIEKATKAVRELLAPVTFGDNYFSILLTDKARDVKFVSFAKYELELAVSALGNTLWVKPTRECLKSIVQKRELKPPINKSNESNVDDSILPPEMLRKLSVVDEDTESESDEN